MDRDFDEYRAIAQAYLNRPVFSGSPLTGHMLAGAAQRAYKRTGQYVPPELALAQGQFETRLGTDDSGRPSYRVNPYNVGEFDEGTQWTYPTTEAGVQAYYDLMANDYLRNNTVEGLLSNFVNYRGDRYASDKNYEQKIRDQMDYIRKKYMR